MKKITIKDVAARAGVSVSAVSHVLNGYSDMSATTVEKVQTAAKDLGYVANSAARQLSSKKSKTIALILNEINVARGVAMPLEIISGVIDYLDKTDYEFVFYATNTEKQAHKTLRQFCDEHNISGVIIQGLRVTDPYYHELEHFTLPTVAIDMNIRNKRIGTVSIDNETAAFEVTERLQASGYHQILFVNGGRKAAVSHERESGYRKSVTKPSVIFADFREQVAFDLIFALFSAEKKPIYDAIFAASDLMAIGCLKALKKLDLASQIAVVGFDDITLTSYFTPTITTVHQDVKTIAESAAKDVIEHIEKGIIKHTIVGYEIVVRESAAI
ncbi:LacI family transcriptional regulator [Lactococcus hodotermopsidis]|uniref:LacI family transcriptional regulator n=2 Tax=Pseudolactococcus hodotermopsidis TaxID=2709157 RepID=A0A6A0BA93_9LACT|nr:LacI family transcriptional regulator [Lactococcus hodotermopsidis]